MIYVPRTGFRPRLRGMPSVLQDASFAAPALYALTRRRRVVPSSAAQQHSISATASARTLRPHAEQFELPASSGLLVAFNSARTVSNGCSFLCLQRRN